MAEAPTITEITAREVLDCRGLPTVQVELELDGAHRGVADVPAGRSTGSAEAHERRDGGERFGGLGVLGAVAAVNGEIADALRGSAPGSQRMLDRMLCELDGTQAKRRLGANALLGVSLAHARARAARLGQPLYAALNADAHQLPVPLVNLINGGKHASNDLDIQEVIVLPAGASCLREAMRWSSEINLALAEILLARYGKVALNTGDEGGFAPPLAHVEEALELLHEAVRAAGYAEGCVYGLDAAATHWYDPERGVYRLAGEELGRDALIGRYERLIADYGIVTIEDPLHEGDLDGFAELTAACGIQIVGDDLLVTDPRRVREAVDRRAANSLLWKVNQIGTLSEALDAAQIAHRAGWTVVVSERSGETEDPIIADLAVALGASQIKTGAPVRGERTAKYNRLMRIEEELAATARYDGSSLLSIATSGRCA